MLRSGYEKGESRTQLYFTLQVVGYHTDKSVGPKLLVVAVRNNKTGLVSISSSAYEWEPKAMELLRKPKMGHTKYICGHMYIWRYREAMYHFNF